RLITNTLLRDFLALSIQTVSNHSSRAWRAHAERLFDPTNFDFFLVPDGFAKQFHQTGIGALPVELVKRVTVEIIVGVRGRFLLQLILQEIQLVISDYPQ